eukprot:TRINITY_DN4880_c0_g1_i1.p1 TRINITY_DN4880_c0_g1~~TRINITY_DN4880_c0_g1_i1.p1  ORF type:complete len:321 (+),score=20.71 TRINITY_DN4880_c0_g1_i1:97-1059(+)
MTDKTTQTTMPDAGSAPPTRSRVQHLLATPGVSEAVGGFFSGVVGTFFGHPLDTIKVRLQTQHRYKGVVDCFVRVLREEGVTQGFYKGLVPPLVSLTFLNTISFSIFSQFKRVFADPSASSAYHFLLPYAAGAFTGAASSIFSTPFEMIKVRMQLDNVSARKFKSSFHCTRSLIKEYGLKSLYVGSGVNAIRETIFCTAYFGTYDRLRSFFNNNNFAKPFAVVLSGGCSGVLGWFCSFPLDVIKTNIQGQKLDYLLNNHGNQYQGFREVSRHIWQVKGGLFGFYTGLLPSITRACIVSSLRFSAYETTLSVIRKFNDSVT